MKKLTIITVVIVLLGVGLATATASVGNHWTETENTKNNEQAKQAQEVVIAGQSLEAQEAKVADLTAKLDSARIACEKGAVAYSYLTPYQKKLTQQPVCPPANVTQ